MPGTLEDTWVDIVTLRAELVELLTGQPDRRWDEPCLPGWRVRDVAAHVLLPPPTAPAVAWGLLRAGFDRTRYGHDLAVRRAAASVPELLTAFRHATESRWMPRSRRPEQVLAELYVHTQDVRRALGAPRPVDAALVRAVLDTLATDRSLGDPARVDGLRLVATDVGWTRGDGPEVSGTGDALVLALAGRRAVLGDLAGDGVAVLAARLPQ